MPRQPTPRQPAPRQPPPTQRTSSVPLPTLLATVAIPFAAGIAEACPMSRPELSTEASAKPPNFQTAIAALLLVSRHPAPGTLPRPRLREAERVRWLLSKLQPQTARNIGASVPKLPPAKRNTLMMV